MSSVGVTLSQSCSSFLGPDRIGSSEEHPLTLVNLFGSRGEQSVRGRGDHDGGFRPEDFRTQPRSQTQRFDGANGHLRRTLGLAQAGHRHVGHLGRGHVDRRGTDSNERPASGEAEMASGRPRHRHVLIRRGRVAGGLPQGLLGRAGHARVGRIRRTFPSLAGGKFTYGFYCVWKCDGSLGSSVNDYTMTTFPLNRFIFSQS